MGILGVKQLSLMRRVKANIEHMSGLLDQIIQLTRQSHSPLGNQSPVDIREAIETAINAVSSKVREKSLRLDLKLADNLPPVPSEGDAFYQIVAHLLNNACQVSMTDGRIMISAHHDTIQEKSLDGDVELFDFLHLAITDSGQGLSREIHSLVLEAHRRPVEERLLRANDVGHSLATAVSLVQAHGGRVWLSNEMEVGDTLSVLLPLASNGYTNGNLG
jgi:signal transduction histidine kinase